MATLASTILDRCERTLSFDRTSVGIPGLESTNLLSTLNAAVKEYHASFEKSGEPSFLLKREIGYTVIEDTYLTSDFLLTDNSFFVNDSSEFDTIGSVVIWTNDNPDYLEYNDNDLITEITPSTGTDINHYENNVVSYLYPLPDNFDSFRSEEENRDGVLVNGQQYEFTSGPPSGRKFTIYDNGTNKYLHFPRGITGNIFIRYNTIPTVVDSESDTVDIPVKDEDYAYWYLVKYCALRLERVDMFQMASAEMLKVLNSAHVRRNIGKGFRLRPMGRTSIPRSAVFD